MKRFVEGTDREQGTLFPECLDDWIDENNPVRVIDAFVETLDLTTCADSYAAYSDEQRWCPLRRIMIRWISDPSSVTLVHT